MAIEISFEKFVKLNNADELTTKLTMVGYTSASVPESDKKDYFVGENQVFIKWPGLHDNS